MQHQKSVEWHLQLQTQWMWSLMLTENLTLFHFLAKEMENWFEKLVNLKNNLFYSGCILSYWILLWDMPVHEGWHKNSKRILIQESWVKLNTRMSFALEESSFLNLRNQLKTWSKHSIGCNTVLLLAMALHRVTWLSHLPETTQEKLAVRCCSLTGRHIKNF